MAIRVSREEAQHRLAALQHRTQQSAGDVLVRRGVSPDQIHREIRAYLQHASDPRLIQQSPDFILQHLRAKSKKDRNGKENIAIALGDRRNFHEDWSLPHFIRSDGARFDVALTLRREGNSTEILAYSFPLWFENHPDLKPIRFDLNEPGHNNEGLGLRSHVHLNLDDEGFSVPTPIMQPLEVLDVLLFGLLPGVGKVRHPNPVPDR